jgi:energy-coupling factor transporter ATP-binding protein EcfA2
MGMHITKVAIDGAPPVEDVTLYCDERVNLFIGPNASGKSTILRAINGLHSYLYEYLGDNIIITHDGERTLCFLWPSDDWLQYPPGSDGSDGSEFAWDAVPILYIPATRVNLRGRDIFTQTIEPPENIETNDPLKDLFNTDSGIFYGQYVELAIDQLRDEMAPTPPLPGERTYDWREKMNIDRSQQRQFRHALEVGYSCAKQICREVVDDDIPHPYEDHDYYDERVVHYGMGVGTSDDILGEPLYAGVLSSGTQGTLLWIYALALKMAHHYDWEEGWGKKPAILLIDEIENHLHPTWQRRVIPALLEHFPGLQIFATTHSPFVVAGREAGQVHLLKRDENGRVTATTNTEVFPYWDRVENQGGARSPLPVVHTRDNVVPSDNNCCRGIGRHRRVTPCQESAANRREKAHDGS